MRNKFINLLIHYKMGFEFDTYFVDDIQLYRISFWFKGTDYDKDGCVCCSTSRHQNDAMDDLFEQCIEQLISTVQWTLKNQVKP